MQQSIVLRRTETNRVAALIIGGEQLRTYRSHLSFASVQEAVANLYVRPGCDLIPVVMTMDAIRYEHGRRQWLAAQPTAQKKPTCIIGCETYLL